jgi:hypothetical protein
LGNVRSYCPVAPQLVMVQAALRKPNKKEKPGSQPEFGSTSVNTYAAECLSFCMTNSVMQTATSMVMWNTEYVLVSRLSQAVDRLLMVAWKMANAAMVPMTWCWAGEYLKPEPMDTVARSICAALYSDEAMPQI